MSKHMDLMEPIFFTPPNQPSHPIGGRVLYKGGGGGQSQRDATEEERRLWAAQAQSLEDMTNIAMPTLRTGMNNLGYLTNQAMDGTLAQQLADQAGRDVNVSLGTSANDAIRSLTARGGQFDPTTGRGEDTLMQWGLGAAKQRAGAMGQARMAAEDQKWQRNAAMTGLASGQGNTAVQGMGSLAGQIGANRQAGMQADAQSAQGYGMMGAYIGNALFKADGGEVRLADGGSPSMPRYNPIAVHSGEAESPRPAVTFGGPIGASIVPAIGRFVFDAMRRYNEREALGVAHPTRPEPNTRQEVSPVDGAPKLNGGGGLQMYKPARPMGMNPMQFGNSTDTEHGSTMQALGAVAQPIMLMAAGDIAKDALAKTGITDGLKGAWAGVKESVTGALGGAPAAATVQPASTSAFVANPTAGFDAVTNGTTQLMNGGLGEAGGMMVTPTSTAGGTAVTAGSTAAGTSAGAGTLGSTIGTAGSTTAGAAAGGGAMAGLAAAAPWLLGGYAVGSMLDLWAEGGPVPKKGLGRKDMTKQGGSVRGPGTETSDSIPAWLSDGEYVVNAEAMKNPKDAKKVKEINQKGLRKRNAKKGVKLSDGGSPPARKKGEADAAYLNRIKAGDQRSPSEIAAAQSARNTGQYAADPVVSKPVGLTRLTAGVPASVAVDAIERGLIRSGG